MAERYLNTNEIVLEELKAKELNENTNKSTKFWLKVWQEWALARLDYQPWPSECRLVIEPRLWRENMMLTMRIIQFCHANNKQVIVRCCSSN
jgi:hypothetical protein